MKQIIFLAIIFLWCINHLVWLISEEEGAGVETRDVPSFEGVGLSTLDQEQKEQTLKDIATLLGIEFSNVSQKEAVKEEQPELEQKVADISIRIVSISTVDDQASVRVYAKRGAQVINDSLSVGSELFQLEVVEITPKQIVFTGKDKRYSIDIYRPKKVKS
ncbi:hypothetical protein EXT46_14875 [Pseudoalteromonas sp. CO325X]|uniref:hypothetical protein n=1 Tax=Pseudoalteromonas sp. CO325X TaxID=1777262 RepID=UPI001023A0B7|nr:hypothetical protein [Pseudoalteromonas sp. CO325X]RZF79173.1 hypothetical protein EXT46_14875 [Pseudoalteromonas sp. CO325X]